MRMGAEHTRVRHVTLQVGCVRVAEGVKRWHFQMCTSKCETPGWVATGGVEAQRGACFSRVGWCELMRCGDSTGHRRPWALALLGRGRPARSISEM